MEPRIIFVFLLFLGAKVNLLGKFLYDREVPNSETYSMS